MSRSRLLQRFGLSPPQSRARKAQRRLSPGRNCNAASGPTFPLLPTKPNGKPTAMMTRSQLICGDAQEVLDTLPSRLPNTTSSTFSLVGGQFPATDQPLTPHALRAIDDRPAACELYEPRRPDFPFAGIFVGILASNRRRVYREAMILLGLSGDGRRAGGCKGRLPRGSDSCQTKR